jgi:hypothetical protein
VPENLDWDNCGQLTEGLDELCQQTQVLAEQGFEATVEEQLQKPDYSQVLVPLVSLSKVLYEN